MNPIIINNYYNYVNYSNTKFQQCELAMEENR